MKRGILFFILAVVIFLLLLFLFPKKKRDMEKFEFLGEEEKFDATLFFLDPEGRFVRVEKKLKGSEFVEDRIKECIYALKIPPEGLFSPLPKELEVKDVIFSDGIVYINFSEEVLKIPFGTRSELETIYGIVNSLSATFSEVKGVKFLVSSSEIETLGGHISLKEVIYPDLQIFEK